MTVHHITGYYSSGSGGSYCATKKETAMLVAVTGDVSGGEDESRLLLHTGGAERCHGTGLFTSQHHHHDTSQLIIILHTHTLTHTHHCPEAKRCLSLRAPRGGRYY